MVLNGEGGLESEVHVKGIRLENVSEFKYLGCILNESGTDGAECSRKVTNRLKCHPWLMLGICSLSVLESCMKHCLCLFICMAMRKRYGKRRRDLE